MLSRCLALKRNLWEIDPVLSEAVFWRAEYFMNMCQRSISHPLLIFRRIEKLNLFKPLNLVPKVKKPLNLVPGVLWQEPGPLVVVSQDVGGLPVAVRPPHVPGGVLRVVLHHGVPRPGHVEHLRFREWESKILRLLAFLKLGKILIKSRQKIEVKLI